MINRYLNVAGKTAARAIAILCLPLLACTLPSHADVLEDTTPSQLLRENFEDGNAKGWALKGRGNSKVTVYEGNHSLNLTRNRSAQISVSTKGHDIIEITMQLAAMNLAEGESCKAQISINNGERWQTLLTVTPVMADAVTLHTKSGRIKNVPDTLLLRFIANGGRQANCWGDNVSVIGKS